MATRVRQFSRDHPSDDPSHAKVLERLENRLARAESLLILERSGKITEQTATGRRNELRLAMQSRLLRHLVPAGELASKEHPELIGRFRLRMPNATHKSFVVSTKAMLADGLSHKEALVSLGLSEAMFDELGKALEEFEKVGEAGVEGRRDHIGARAELETINGELSQLVDLLDTFNRHRLRDDPRLSAEWARTRAVYGPKSRSAIPPTPDGVKPPEGGVAPAA